MTDEPAGLEPAVAMQQLALESMQVGPTDRTSLVRTTDGEVSIEDRAARPRDSRPAPNRHPSAVSHGVPTAPDPPQAPPPEATQATDDFRAAGAMTVPAARVVFYVDADNQSSQRAAELIALFGPGRGVTELGAVIAGNNSGSQIDAWSREFLAAAPGMDVVSVKVPQRSQAADVALIAELGARIEDHAARDDLLVVVSRDDLLVAAAEHASTRGCRAVAAYADTDPPAGRSSRVATVLLPPAASDVQRRVKTPAVAAAAAPLIGDAGAGARVPKQSADEPRVGPTSDPALVLAALRTLCRRDDAGLYPASDVGQGLAKLGFDAKARRSFLATATGICAEGKATKKAYRF